MLSEKQAQEIKKQLLSQIENFPADKRKLAEEQINAMDSGQLEEFLKQNNLVQGDGKKGQCIFCSIAGGQTESYKIDENQDAVAVLEINPISKAHTIIIPKQHNENPKEISNKTTSLAKKIADKIQTKFKPKDIIISPSTAFGHTITNILPIYKDETINSQRTQAKTEDLLKIQKKLQVKEKKEVIKEPKPIKLGKLKLPIRIP